MRKSLLFLLVVAIAASGRYAIAQEGLPSAVAENISAAEKGDAKAQLNLGRRFYFSRGLPQDYEKAATWFQIGRAHV